MKLSCTFKLKGSEKTITLSEDEAREVYEFLKQFFEPECVYVAPYTVMYTATSNPLTNPKLCAEDVPRTPNGDIICGDF